MAESARRSTGALRRESSRRSGVGGGSRIAQNITVAVRVRPLSAKELARGAFSCALIPRPSAHSNACITPVTLTPAAPLRPAGIITQDGEQINVNDPDDKMGGIDYLRLDKTKDKSYRFDHAFDNHVDQQTVYEATTMPIIDSVVAGCNACCFAYGATGAHLLEMLPESSRALI